MFENNPVCRMLGIKYPIFQGGMAWIGTAELASAVSNAGGLGLIGAGHMPPDALRNEIRKVKGWTDKPFGVNVMLMSPFVKEVMQVVLEERVPVITTGAGNPGEYVPALKEIGSKVIPVVASVALARRLVRTGVDAGQSPAGISVRSRRWRSCPRWLMRWMYRSSVQAVSVTHAVWLRRLPSVHRRSRWAHASC